MCVLGEDSRPLSAKQYAMQAWLQHTDDMNTFNFMLHLIKLALPSTTLPMVPATGARSTSHEHAREPALHMIL